MQRFSFLSKLSTTQYVLIALIVLGGGGWYLLSGNTNTEGQTITIQEGDFLEQVAVAGEVKPAKNVDLAFEQSGRVSGVYASVGQGVTVGTLLATLSSGELSASVSQKEAALAAQQAKLDGLKAGAQPEDVAASLAALEKAKQDLTNMYAGISDKLADAFGKGTDAVRVQLSPIFSGADTNDPQLSYSTTDSQSAIDASTARVQSRTALSAWQAELNTISPYSNVAVLEKSLVDGLAHLSIIRILSQDVINTLTSGTNLSVANLASYKAAATTALSETNSAITSLNNAAQNIASQKIAIQQLQAQYDLKKAGATTHDIAAQQASVDGAVADVASARAQLAKSVMRAPFSGTVTKMDAKVGQIVSPTTPVVSMISNGIFQIECFIPEVDIARISVGDTASTTLDAYGVEQDFSARVIAIDPAQTLKNGVATYKTTLQFNSADPRIRSGMTANAIITTSRISGAISVPKGAIFQKGTDSYVQLLIGENSVDTKITIDSNASQIGNVRVTSGLQVGDVIVLIPDTSL